MLWKRALACYLASDMQFRDIVFVKQLGNNPRLLITIYHTALYRNRIIRDIT